jgi:hypothetical protein
MNSVFISGYYSGSYDSYQEANLRAFATKEEAEAFNLKHQADDERAATIYHEVSSGMQDWILDWQNAQPVFRACTIPIPQWPGVRGSKKKAPREEVEAFNRHEAEVRALHDKAQQEYGVQYDAWHQLGVVESKRLMALAGATQEEIDACTQIVTGGTWREERIYTVEELPFGNE